LRYAIDQQSFDMRGGVGGETVWELCCRFLSHPLDARALGSSEVAQLLVYWLDEKQLPAQMYEAIFAGMLAELETRGKTIVTQDDETGMKTRWVKQAIHGELDNAREVWLSKQTSAPVDLEVEGGIVEGEQTSLVAEAELEATKILTALNEEEVRCMTSAPIKEWEGLKEDENDQTGDWEDGPHYFDGDDVYDMLAA
jgi:hypothetical protein